MTDQQVIEKAKKALIEMGLFSDEFTDINITKKIYSEMLEDFPEHEFEYKVHFSDTEEVPRMRGRIGVAVDRNTHKLLYAVNKAGIYEIPEHLK